MEDHEVEVDADEAKQLRAGFAIQVFSIEIEQAIIDERLGPDGCENFELPRIEQFAVHDVRLLFTDHGNSVFKLVDRQVFNRLDFLAIIDGKQRYTILREVRYAIDFRVAFDEAFEPDTGLFVVAQIQRRAEFVELLGPLQCPAAVVVLQHPLSAPVKTRDRETAKQGGAQNLDRQDLVDEDTFRPFCRLT